MKMLYGSLFRLIGKKNRTRVLLLQILFLLTALFQVAGIASIAPFITMVSNPGFITTNTYLTFLFNLYAFESDSQFIVTYALFVILLIIVSNSIASYSLWKLFQISMRLGAHVQRTIYKSYLDNDYTFFAINNSSRLISQITQEIPRMVYMVVQPILTLISQLFIAALIIVGLLIIDISIALTATAIVGSVYFLIFKLIRSRVVESGNLISTLNLTKLKLLDESIGGIKEVKLKGTEDYYKQQVDRVTVRGLSASAYIALAGDLPRFMVETVVFASILGLSIYILLTSGTANEALSTISLYAMAGYKLLPAAQSIYRAYSQIRANGSVVLALAHEIEKSTAHDSPLRTLGNEPAPEGDIVFNDVAFRYPNTAKFALARCNLRIAKNKITAFVGTSGAGKSTAVDLLLALLVPTCGSITVGDIALDKQNIKAWRQKIGYVAQTIFILDASFQENIALGIPELEVDPIRLKKAAQLANLYDFIAECDGGFNFKLGERGAKLSGGQKQRIGIARALYQDPAILVLDEATSALDNVTEQLIMNDILSLAQTRTIVMIAHRLTTVENADNIFVFKLGKIEDQGTYQSLANNSLEFKALLSAGKGSNK